MDLFGRTRPKPVAGQGETLTHEEKVAIDILRERMELWETSRGWRYVSGHGYVDVNGKRYYARIGQFPAENKGRQAKNALRRMYGLSSRQWVRYRKLLGRIERQKQRNAI